MKTRLPFPGLREALLWAVLSFPGLLVAQNRPQLAPEEQAHYHHDGCGREHGHPRLDGFGKELLQSVGPLEGHIPAVQRFAARTSATCTSGNAGWASLSSSALVAELKSVDDYQACFAVWYSWDASYSPSIFSTANITAVAQEMYNISIASDGTFNGGMYGLVTYLHAAVYHEFYQPVVTLDANAQYWLRIACESFANNSHLWDLTSEAIAILDEYLIIIDYDGIRSRPAIINVIESALDRLTNQQTWSAIQNDQQLMQDYARTYNRPFFAIFRGNQDADFKEALNGDSSFWTVLQQTGVSTTLRNNGNLSFMTDNAILELTRMANEPTLIDDIESLIAAAAGQFARLDVNWLRCVEAINDYGNCASYGLCEDPEALEAELKAFLFPNQYSFDDGLMQISTPLAEDEVQELYHAAKQVQNQFFRLLQTDEPVMGDVNDTLNMIVFGSKSQYDAYANYLYGISTNNGGIYIERWSTFFTWDRTVGVESSLSLESLFRHEYVHYLQGRYLIPGYWGETTMYQNSRMVWYEEGMAELFAGSTDTDGVNLLASNVNTVTNAAPNWPTLSTVFNSNYSSGNFNHYYYGNMAWYHWYQNDFGQLKTFFDLTRADDVTGFDNLVNNLRTSGTSSFNTFLSKVSNGEVPGWEPTTEWKADDQLAVADLAGVENEFTALTGITPASVGFETQSLNRRFQITGTVSGSQAAGNNTDAAQQINEALDNILTDMRSNPFLSNFDYSVGYFTDLDYSGAVPTATFVISGPLRDPNVSASPVADFTGAPTVTVAGGTVQFQNTSTGYLSGLSWSFPGATSTTGTTGQTPTATYANPGTYSVSLTANGAEGSSDTETKNGYIEVYPVSTQNYCAASADLDYNYVSRVQLGTINNTSGWDSYGDYRNSLAVLSLGNAETLTVNLDVESWEYNAVGAWIDWNQDGDFEDAGEEVLRVYGAGPYVASITPPAGATLGTTAMRIRIGYGSEDKITPCGVDTYMGDVEDYSIRVNDQAQPTPPVANFTASTTSILTGESINFTDLTSNSPTSWSWTFAGGSPASSSAQNPTIAYNSAGTYEVSLTATNADGSDTKTVSSYITVSDPVPTPPIANFTANATSILTGESVTFSDLSTNSPTGWSWTFSGGSPASSSAQNPTVAYSTAGTYSVSLTATNADGSDSKTVSSYITVTDPVINYCSASAAQNTNYITRVQLGGLDNSTNWDSYGDYRNLTATLNQGSTATLTVTTLLDYWTYNAVGAWIDWNKDGDFDDAGEEVLHVYGAGPYTASITPPAGANTGTTTMRVRKGYGSESKITPCGADTYFGDVEDYTIQINGPAQPVAPVANFTASATTVNTGQVITLTDASTHQPTAWNWSMTGGSPASSSQQNTSVSYSVAGTYTITLTASNGAGSDSHSITVTVNDAPPSYCIPTTSLDYNWISRVAFANLDVASNAWNNGYTDFTGNTANVSTGSTYTLTVEPNVDYWSGIDVQAWIDWNRDGTFSSSERVYARRGTGPYSSNVSVPTNAVLGSVRMRVRLAYGKSPDPCESDTYMGETEDFLVNISSGTAGPAGWVGQKQPALSVFPNPSNGQFTLELSSPALQTVSVYVLSLEGKMVYQKSISTEGLTRHSLDLSHLSTGIYFLKVASPDRVQNLELTILE